MLRTEDEDNERKETDPRAENDGPADVEGTLVGECLELESLEDVPKEPNTNQSSDDQNHDARNTLVEVVDDGGISSGIVPDEEGQVEHGQDGHGCQDDGGIALRNDVRSNSPSLRNQNDEEDDGQVDKHVQEITKGLETLDSNAVALQGRVVDHLEHDGEELQENSDGDDAHDRMEGLGTVQLPRGVRMGAQKAEIEDEEDNVHRGQSYSFAHPQFIDTIGHK